MRRPLAQTQNAKFSSLRAAQQLWRAQAAQLPPQSLPAPRPELQLAVMPPRRRRQSPSCAATQSSPTTAAPLKLIHGSSRRLPHWFCQAQERSQQGWTRSGGNSSGPHRHEPQIGRACKRADARGAGVEQLFDGRRHPSAQALALWSGCMREGGGGWVGCSATQMAVVIPCGP